MTFDITFEQYCNIYKTNVAYWSMPQIKNFKLKLSKNNREFEKFMSYSIVSSMTKNEFNVVWALRLMQEAKLSSEFTPLMVAYIMDSIKEEDYEIIIKYLFSDMRA